MARSRRKTTAKKNSDVKNAPVERVEAQVVAPYGSDEYFAAWDAADTDELAAAVAAWDTGEGTEESPWHPVPDADTVALIRQHEVDGQNRDEVLAAIDAKVVELAASPTPDAGSVDGHDVTIDETDDDEFEALYSSTAWIVSCSCGWSEKRTTEQRAHESAKEHLQAVADGTYEAA